MRFIKDGEQWFRRNKSKFSEINKKEIIDDRDSYKYNFRVVY